MVRLRQRLEFYLHDFDVPVGRFLGRAYPRTPGKYAYEACRGKGHFRFAQLLKRGKNPRCWFSRGRQRVDFLVDREEFVREKSKHHWIVGICQVLD